MIWNFSQSNKSALLILNENVKNYGFKNWFDLKNDDNMISVINSLSASSNDAYDKFEFSHVIISQNWSCFGNEDYEDATSALHSSSSKSIADCDCYLH